METISKNNIGLDIDKSKIIAEKLNELLSNYQQFYMNLRGFHWNIKGKKFFELHLKFEELYNDALLKIDEIAERVLTLSETPVHSFRKYLKISEIKPAENITNGEQAVDKVLEALKVLLAKERITLNMASEANDEGTVALMSDYIVQQEKLVWMLSSFLD